MLPDKYCSLLTAYVDGELSERKKRAVRRLIKKSSKARKLLHELERDSRELTALPKKTAPEGFTDTVLDKIQATSAPQPASPASTTTQPEHSIAPNWMGLALAASVLAAITYGSYLYFSQDSHVPGNAVAVKQERKTNNKDKLVPEENSAEKAPKLQFALSELDNKDIKKKLHEELKQQTSIHLNMTTNDNTVAADQLSDVFKSKGITLLVDDKAEEDLKAKKKTKFVLYVEDLQPKEVEDLLSDLAKSKSKDSPAVQTVALNPLKSEQREEMAKLLGVGAEDLQPAKKKITLNVKDLPDRVIIPGKKSGGKKGKKKDSNSTQKNHLAVMLAYDSSSPAESSKQIASFLKSRQAQRPDGTLQLVIVLEQTV